MTSRRQTFDAFIIHTIMPAPGWQAVYHTDAGEHWLAPLHALALVTRYTRERGTQRIIQDVAEERREEFREVVGMEYSPGDGWNICEDASNCCAMLPPDWTLAQYEDTRNCRHTPQEVTP